MGVGVSIHGGLQTGCCNYSIEILQERGIIVLRVYDQEGGLTTSSDVSCCVW